MKKITSTLLLSFIIFIGFSQDIIVKKTGEDIKAKVLEVGLSGIKYKKFENLEGPAFTILKKDVLIIRYKNGTKDIFNKNIETKSTGNTALPQEANTDTVKKHKIQIGFLFGAGVPIGDFANKEINSQTAGFAKTGGLVDFSLAYKLNNYFALSGAVRGQLNQMDAQTVADGLAKQNPNTSWTIQTKSWTIGSLMLGVITSLPLSEKAYFDIKTMIGYSKSTTPELTAVARSTTNGNTGSATSSSGSAFSLSYLIGAGFRFEISNKLSLLTNVDYFGTNPNFVDVKTTGSTGQVSFSSYNQNMKTVNINIGLAIKL